MLLEIAADFMHCEFKKLKTNLALFLIFFWVFWLSQILAISTMFMSLPDIRELPVELLTVIGASPAGTTENDRLLTTTAQGTQLAEEQIIKFNDSGGDVVAATPSIAIDVVVKENIPNDVGGDGDDGNAIYALPEPQRNVSGEPASVNHTLTEEIPMPVFSEWAEKQMAEQQALEQEVVNNANAQKKKNNSQLNGSNGSGENGSGGNSDGRPKAITLKIRAKNYASPDCGAKIIASNADATNTGAVLSASKDEYMLSPCGNRIWFVVELCEAIQAQTIDLANFELFSSSPHNFTVAVSNRFPTRDWSNVGRFNADDQRSVQSFELQPHLFGKFVRVDIHSHYAKEHFCPVSLFRVFGTSEFEAFETENRAHDSDLDDFDEELALGEQAHILRNQEQPNLFRSASDAVMLIVKKAAEVLAKPAASGHSSGEGDGGTSSNGSLVGTPELVCRSPAFAPFICGTDVPRGGECTLALVERVNVALSCELPRLMELLRVMRSNLVSSKVCATEYGLSVATAMTSCTSPDEKRQEVSVTSWRPCYLVSLLPKEYVAALCQLLFTQRHATDNGAATRIVDDADDAVNLNLTIDKKTVKGDFELGADGEQWPPASSADLSSLSSTTESQPSQSATSRHEQRNEPPATSLPIIGHQPADGSSATATTTVPPTTVAVPQINVAGPTVTPAPKNPDEVVVVAEVNIFNVIPTLDDVQPEITEDGWLAQPLQENERDKTQQQFSIDANSGEAASETGGTPATSLRNDEDPIGVWDNFDNLLTMPTYDASTHAPQAKSTTVTTTATPPGGTTYVNPKASLLPNGGGVPQSESIFIRLSNRIKTLERNMSLSGQYLEELSRRYKKQVEELQQTLTQQTQQVRALEEQSRRHDELEELLAERNRQLRSELVDLALQVHACIAVIICVGALVFLGLLIGLLYYRALRHNSGHATLTLAANAGVSFQPHTVGQQLKFRRRKSFDDYAIQQQEQKQELTKPGTDKQRRRSEEAMLEIREACNAIVDTVGDATSGTQVRHRKISVYYDGTEGGGGSGGSKRKSAKHSWPQTAEQRQNVWHSDAFFDLDTLTRPSAAPSNGHEPGDIRGAKKKPQQFKRQESAPSRLPAQRLNASAPAAVLSGPAHEYSDLPQSLLDEEDLDNFIPNADLAYNEFMPDGPSGYQAVTPDAMMPNDDHLELTGGKVHGKTRRLTTVTSNFFKSPFGRSLSKASGAPATKLTPPHASTSWEWYRSSNKKSNAMEQLEVTAPVNALRRASPALSADSSSLSEFNFPTNCVENSFRILEEAILSSGEASVTSTRTATTKIATTTSRPRNGKGYVHSSSASGGSGSSNRSSTSTTSSAAGDAKVSKMKKNQRSFNRIFRKVF